MKHNLLNLDEFQSYLQDNGKSRNTVSSYVTSVKKYVAWFQEKYRTIPTRLFAENIIDYKSFLEQCEVNPSTFNTHISGLRSWNEFLVQKGHQSEVVVQKTDKKKVQPAYASPAIHSKEEIQRFLQCVLEGESKRDYAMVQLLAYTGLRISEALDLTFEDLHLAARECVVRDGKGGKTRTVFLSDRVVRSIREYVKNEREMYRLAQVSPYLFVSNRSQKLSRITVYKAFNKYSEKALIQLAISPHDLRHFFCSNALEKGFDVHEVASMAGHSNIHTTLLYTNPSRKTILEKINQL